MHLDIYYIWIHNKSNVSRIAKTSYNLEWREYIVIRGYAAVISVLLSGWYGHTIRAFTSKSPICRYIL